MLAPPGPDAGVHPPPPQRRDHGEGGHQRIAEGKLGRLVRPVGLQKRESPVRALVIVGMALEVDEQPVGRGMGGVPAVPRPDGFVASVAEAFARQAVMLDIVDEFQMPDRDQRLPEILWGV